MIKVVMVSVTALAGAPYENMKCLNKYHGDRVQVRWVADRYSYRDGRVFPKDLSWREDREESIRVLREADVIHLQNDLCPFVDKYITDKPRIIQLHSVPKRGVWGRVKGWGSRLYGLRQPLQEREYGNIPALPNMLDPEEYKPEPVVRSEADPLRVLFAPTNRWRREVSGSKAAAEVEAILRDIPGIKPDIYERISYVENLERKRRADIIVDDVVGDTFHKTTLEGCCFGAAVITSSDRGPWYVADLGSLRKAIEQLVQYPTLLRRYRDTCRRWVESVWHPRLIGAGFVRAYEKQLERRKGAA